MDEMVMTTFFHGSVIKSTRLQSFVVLISDSKPLRLFLLELSFLFRNVHKSNQSPQKKIIALFVVTYFVQPDFPNLFCICMQNFYFFASRCKAELGLGNAGHREVITEKTHVFNRNRKKQNFYDRTNGRVYFLQ